MGTRKQGKIQKSSFIIAGGQMGTSDRELQGTVNKIKVKNSNKKEFLANILSDIYPLLPDILFPVPQLLSHLFTLVAVYVQSCRSNQELK